MCMHYAKAIHELCEDAYFLAFERKIFSKNLCRRNYFSSEGVSLLVYTRVFYEVFRFLRLCLFEWTHATIPLSEYIYPCLHEEGGFAE